MRVMVAAVVMGGCTFAPTAVDDAGPHGDGPRVDMRMIDMHLGPPTCLDKWHAGTATFGTAVRIDELATTSFERHPWLSADELTIVFTTDRGGSASGVGDVWTATRASTSMPFGMIMKIPSCSTTYDENRITFNAANTIAVMASDRTDGNPQGSADLWISTRSSATGTSWPGFTQTDVAALNDGDAQLDPFLSRDGLRLYFAPAASLPTQKIVVASRASVGVPFSPAVTLIDGHAGGDYGPALDPDEQVMVFASHRAGPGGTDLWYAARPDPSAAFGPVRRLDSLASNVNETDPFLSSDGCRLYFASDRLGSFDLYMATMQ